MRMNNMIFPIPTLATLTALPGILFAATEVTSEQIGSSRDDWNKPAWEFKSIHRPSLSDAAAGAKITVASGQPQASCLPAAALNNGVMPQQTRLRRDFFTFENGSDGGVLVIDLGKAVPVVEINSFSAHGPVGGTTWCTEFDGARGPQVYSLYGSNSGNANPAAPANLSAWTKIADVDTRPKSGPWGGRWGVNIRDGLGAPLGTFRWLAWHIKRTDKSYGKPYAMPDIPPGQYTNTWFAELDVHTAESLAKTGDFVPAGSRLREVVVAYKSHFDIGFTHPAPEIVNIYRTSMIDRALGLIENSKHLPPEQRFAWTIPSWVLFQILAPDQEPARRARIVHAIKEGTLVVHALPVTMHTESLDLEDLVSGLSIHTKLARELEIPLSRSGKMTDVPSHSWILPTLLTHAGIDFLHIGANPTNERPDLPLLYDWEGPDGSRLLTFHNQGYGSEAEFGHGIYPPKDWPYAHWLAVLTSCDNTPPPTEAEIQRLFSETGRTLPGVKIRLGKMEDFSTAIRAEQQAGAVIPVVRADQPDSWIHGVGTMPSMEALARKTRPMLAAAGTLDTLLRQSGLPRPDIRADLFAAYERSMMYGEHTWGTSANLQGRNAYNDKDFASTVANDSVCLRLQKTWDDHAGYIRKADAIARQLTQDAMDQLANAVNVEGERMVVFNPQPYSRDAIVDIPGKPGQKVLVKNIPAAGYTTLPLPSPTATPSTPAISSDNTVLENSFIRITLDRTKGGIISIKDKMSHREWVDPQAPHAFGQYLYERFDRKQIDAYQVACNHLDSVYQSNGGACYGWNVRQDLPATPAHSCVKPEYTAMTTGRDSVCQYATLTAPATGAIAARITLTVTLPDHAPWLEVAIRLDDKQPDYWPENGTLAFPVNARQPQFRIGRVGGISDPARDFARGSNRTYGIVNTGAIIAGEDGKGVAICPLDHGMMSFGTKGIGEIDPDFVPTTPVAKVSLFNNFWTTNFPYWIKGTIISRVRIWATDTLEPAGLVVPALEAQQPVLAAVAAGPAGNLPAAQSAMTLSRPGVRLTRYSPNPDGKGTILRLWEQAGKSGDITVTLSGSHQTAMPVNLRNEQLGAPVKITGGRLGFHINAYAPASFLLLP